MKKYFLLIIVLMIWHNNIDAKLFEKDRFGIGGDIGGGIYISNIGPAAMLTLPPPPQLAFASQIKINYRLNNLRILELKTGYIGDRIEDGWRIPTKGIWVAEDIWDISAIPLSFTLNNYFGKKGKKIWNIGIDCYYIKAIVIQISSEDFCSIRIAKAKTLGIGYHIGLGFENSISSHCSSIISILLKFSEVNPIKSFKDVNRDVLYIPSGGDYIINVDGLYFSWGINYYFKPQIEISRLIGMEKTEMGKKSNFRNIFL